MRCRIEMWQRRGRIQIFLMTLLNVVSKYFSCGAEVFQRAHPYSERQKL